MCNIYGQINYRIFGQGYKYFYVCVRAFVGEFDTDNETLIPILSVLKKQADTRWSVNTIEFDDGEHLCVEAAIVFSYSATGVANMQKVITECENAITKFNRNIYSINTNIVIRERVSEEFSDDNMKRYYKYYIANNIFSPNELIFRRYSTKKFLKIPEYFNFYSVDTENWEYRVYKWPVIVYDNGYTELDNSRSYDPTRDITIGNKTFPKWEIKYIIANVEDLGDYTKNTLKQELERELQRITNSTNKFDVSFFYNFTSHPYITVYIKNDKLEIRNKNENEISNYKKNEVLLSYDLDSFYKNIEDLYNKNQKIVYKEGYCMFGEEREVKLEDYESYDNWSNPIRKTTQSVYISVPGEYYFDTEYVKENTYRFSYNYNIEKKTFSARAELYYDGNDIYEVRYEYVFENDPRKAEQTGAFIYTQTPRKKLELIYPDPSQNLSIQQGRLKVRTTDGTLLDTHFHFERNKKRICTKYGLVNGVWGHYRAYYLYNMDRRKLEKSMYVLDVMRVDGIPYGKDCEYKVVISRESNVASEYHGIPIVYHTYIDYGYNTSKNKIA